MKFLSAVLATIVITLGLAAQAAAAPHLVAPVEAVSNPAFAGDEIVYADGKQVHAVAADGRTRVVGPLVADPVWPNPWDDGFGDFVSVLTELRGSSDAIGARIRHYYGDRYSQSERSDISGGSIAGPLGQIAATCRLEASDQHASVDVDGTRLAYVRETCSGSSTTRQVVVRDLRDGSEWSGPATSTREVRLAGRYVAFRPAGGAGLAVYDVDMRQLARTVSGVQSRFDIQADGTVADSGAQFQSNCTGGVRVWRPGTESPTPVAGCEWTLSAIDDDHLALSKFRGFDRGSLAVLPIGGQAREIDLPGPLAQEPDLDGNRIVFTTRGCSTDTGGIWIDDGRGASDAPEQSPQCAVRVPSTTLRASSKGRVIVPVTCPTGCRGAIAIRGGRRYRQELYSAYPYGDDEMFELAKGQSARIPVNVGQLRRRYGHRTLKVRVEVRVNQRVNPNRYSRVVKYLKLRV